MVLWGPNYNTLSLFKDGQRQTAPQQLPEKLRGKVSGFSQGWIQGGFIGMAFLEQQGQGSRGKTLLRLPDLGHVTLVKWIYCMGAHRETLWRCCSQHSPTKTCLKLSSKKHLRMSLLECRRGSYWCSKTVEECTCQFWSCCLRAFTFQARNLKFLDILQTSLDILPLYPPMISRSKGAGRCKKRPWKIQSWLRINHRRMVGCLGAQLVRSIIRHKDS